MGVGSRGSSEGKEGLVALVVSFATRYAFVMLDSFQAIGDTLLKQKIEA